MICPGCRQEHDDNQPCPNCADEPASNAARQPVPDQATEPSPPDGSGPLPASAPDAAQPGTSPAPSEKDPNGHPVAPGTRIRIDLNDSSVTSTGTSMIAGMVNQIQLLDRSQKVEEEKSLWEFVTPLSARPKRHYRPSDADLQEKIGILIKDRVILIGSSYHEHAFDAAWEVIENLPGSLDRCNRWLAFEDTVGKNIEFSLQKLCDQRSETEPEMVLLVDALDSQANTFPNSILGHAARVGVAKQNLKNSKLFVVVVVNHEYAAEKELSQRNDSYESLSYWDIPFLEPYFQKRFADHDQLLAELFKQRASGKWEENESAFTKQVLNYYTNDVLRDIIKAGGPKDPESSAAAILKTANPVEKTVLYTATFFNEITSPEFCRVVESLLGARTMPSPDIDTNGATPATAKTEVPLRQLWDSRKDDLFTELLVETATATDSPRTVSLSEFNLAEPLRRMFEKRHRFYLIDQFMALQQAGIFFYPSLRVARNTTQLAVDMAQLYPDEFNEGWIVALVMRIREHFARASAEDQPEDSMFNFLSNTQPGAFHLAFARVSEVCQRFLGIPKHKSVVTNSLEYLIKNDYGEEVLWLIKQLKFNPEFDDWHWLKQLLHRADLKTKYLTYYYILSYLKQLGTRVYDGLNKLESWLPPIDRPNPRDIDTFIFRILIKYCLDTINRFNEKHYGRWPSRYALFTATDAATAKSRFALLANCLLHPGVDPTLDALNIDGTRIDLIAILLAEWSFILLGTPSATPTPKNGMKDQHPDENQNCTALEMFDLLLKQFFSKLDLQQRLDLLKYWTQFDSALLIFGHSYSTPNELRNEMKWKRALVQRLIRELKLASRPKPSITNSSGSILTRTLA
jgi:hypothetical protein